MSQQQDSILFSQLVVCLNRTSPWSDQERTRTEAVVYATLARQMTETAKMINKALVIDDQKESTWLWRIRAGEIEDALICASDFTWS